MRNNHSWEVVCVSYQDETDYDDCRALKEIGYLAPSLRTKKVDAVASMINSGLSNFHIMLDGRKIPLKSAEGTRYYARVKDEDTPDDPLLDLPTVTEYKNEKKFNR